MSSVSDSYISGLIKDGTPQGRESVVGGLPCYVAEPQDHSKSKSIIVFADVFGWKHRNARHLADAYSRHGFYVYLPDFYGNSSLSTSFLQTIEPPLHIRKNLSLVDRAKNAATSAGILGPWQQANREAVVMPRIDHFIGAVRSFSGTVKIGALGLSTGGRYAILQAHPPSDATKSGGIDAVVVFHPNSLSVAADLRSVVRPLSIGIAGQDGVVGSESRQSTIEAVNKLATPHEILSYGDQVHGFSYRGDWSDDADRKAMDDAEKQGVKWFDKHLV